MAGLASGVANADCTDSDQRIGACIAAVAHPRTAPPPVETSALRALCAVSACFLVTDLPGAGIGGKP